MRFTLSDLDAWLGGEDVDPRRQGAFISNILQDPHVLANRETLRYAFNYQIPGRQHYLYGWDRRFALRIVHDHDGHGQVPGPDMYLSLLPATRGWEDREVPGEIEGAHEPIRKMPRPWMWTARQLFRYHVGLRGDRCDGHPTTTTTDTTDTTTMDTTSMHHVYNDFYRMQELVYYLFGDVLGRQWRIIPASIVFPDEYPLLPHIILGPVEYEAEED